MEHRILFTYLFLWISFFEISWSYPEEGKWDFTVHDFNSVNVSKSLFSGSKFIVKISCDSKTETEDLLLDVTWSLQKANCWKDYAVTGSKDMAYETPNQFLSNWTSMNVHGEEQHSCDAKGFFLKAEVKKAVPDNDLLDQDKQVLASNKEGDEALQKDEAAAVKLKRENHSKENQLSKTGSSPPPPHFIVDSDGIYKYTLHPRPAKAGINVSSYTIHVHIEILSDYGYLSAVDYPLLIFYSTMCVVYVLYGIAWLIVSFMRWRELLRVQYWIGAVILLGMLEKAVFTAEYENVNKTGVSNPGLIMFAEIVSCAKRTLSRMLVIIVSFGFGIVKPRLGVVLHRVVGVGLLYFVIASIEGCLRALNPNFLNEKEYKLQFFTTIPLALLESAICWWVFSALVTTTRTLRLRRNTTKLNLYRHFTNTLAFAVVTSVVFILWSIKHIKFDLCVSDWKQLWVNDAFWHILFAFVLLVIMILWRPTNNNQRFAYSPLLDGLDGDDEEEEKLMADVSDTMKQRSSRNSNSSPRESRSVEDDLKWLEENIPSSLADSALPMMDSEEEIVNTKFEISKMQ